MAESEQQQKIPSLAVEWSLPEKEQRSMQSEAPVENAAEEGKSAEASSMDIVVEEKSEEIPDVDENSPAVDESNGTSKQEVVEAADTEEPAEEQPEIKIETAPADFRFPTTNQTRHCFTRYIEYHRCIAAKGEDASECNKFAKYYRALCPGEWVQDPDPASYAQAVALFERTILTNKHI